MTDPVSRPTGGASQKGKGRSRGGQKAGKSRLLPQAAKAKVLEDLAWGTTVKSAMERVGRSLKTYEYWRRNDEDFRDKADLARSLANHKVKDRDENRADARAMGFAAWREKYLGVPTYWHQLQWIDLLEGREPRDLHPSETYVPGRPARILINTPPFHAKSTTITIDYVTYRICINPNVRIAIVSKRQEMAAEFLSAVKQRLTHPRFADLIKDFAPEGGYRVTAESWTRNHIYVGVDRDSADPNPTLQALGVKGQIYGSRLDLIILDDCITLANVNEWEDQLRWIRGEVANRPGPGGRILVVGTRVQPLDLYGQLLNGENYGTGKSPWTYLAQPAILEHPTNDHPGRTLWPMASVPWATEDDDCDICDGYCKEIDENGEFPRWDMFHLEHGPKAENDSRTWSLVYMQQSMPADSTFPEFAVMGAVNNRRRYGENGGLDEVPEDAYFIGSMDPATSGDAAAVVLAVDRKSKKRYVVDVVNLKAPSPARLKGVIKEWSIRYPIKEWRVESTGLLTMFTQDAELRSWLTARGIVFRTHYTGRNKWDAAFGVASMASLFGSYDQTETGEWKQIHPPLIELPRLDTPGLKLMVSQLIGWSPDLDPKKIPCDVVMAIWFAEIGARDIVKSGNRFFSNFFKSGFTSPRDVKSQYVYNLADADRMVR